MTIHTQTAAAALAAAFVSYTRNNGERFYKLIKDAPKWMQDAMHDAHGDMMPDDVRYSMIHEIAQAIAERDEDADLDDERGEIVDAVPSCYHSARFAWLASHNSRSDYCDEAQAEGIVAADASISDRIAAGWYQEADEIYSALLQAIETQAEELETLAAD
jgi:hypothetical protein